MRNFWHGVKLHPFSAFFYIIYCLLWCNAYSIVLHPVLEGGLFIVVGFFTAILFSAISLLNAFENNEYKFYLRFIAFLALPVLVVFPLDYLHQKHW